MPRPYDILRGRLQAAVAAARIAFLATMIAWSVAPAQSPLRGVLWGVTSAGGSDGNGTIFWIDPARPEIVTAVTLSPETGAHPAGSLLFAPDGIIYGVTSDGGEHGKGVLFSIDPLTGRHAVRAPFTTAIGTTPTGALVAGGDGALYGLARSGGANDCGTIYRFDLGTGRLERMIDLSPAVGSHPTGSLFRARNGKFYGVTTEGGSGGNGVLFEYDLSSRTLRRRADLPESGREPYGSLIEPTPGVLFGATYNGGGTGAVFSYTTEPGVLVNRMNFTVAKGRSCFGSLVDGGNGKLYALVARGATDDVGALVEFDPLTNSYINKIDLARPLGSHPYGSPMRASDGALYGLTFTGGSADLGVVFRYVPAKNSYTVLASFTGANGANPMFTHLIEAPRPLKP
jgi:uncharacterized repeat protein (TIGR03803 family)